jgi:hypothetical protein
VSWYNLSSTSLQVEINEIPPPLRNGIVLGYHIYLWKKSEGQSNNANISDISATQSVKMFEELEKYTHYCGQIAAYTRIGEGPRSPIECIRTSEDGNENLLFAHSAMLHCLYVVIDELCASFTQYCTTQIINRLHATVLGKICVV